MTAELKSAVTERLCALAEPAYREFQAALIPTVSKERILGVRTPALRKFAGEIANTPQAAAFMETLPHRYYDENNLHAALIARLADFEAVKSALDRFLPYVDNWATCDMIAPRMFLKHPTERVQAAKEWIRSSHTYTVRYAIVLLMKYDLKDTFRPEYAELVASVHSDEYYVKMAQAWYFATALADQYEIALPYLTEHRLDFWTHNKTIQKAIESYRIPDEQKELLRQWKRSLP